MVTFTENQIVEVADLTDRNFHNEARETIALYMNDHEFAEIYRGIIRAHDRFGNAFPMSGGIGNAAITFRDTLEAAFTRRMIDTITNSAAVKGAL